MTALDAEDPLVASVLERVRERLAPAEAARCERFVRQYYRWVPAEDLNDASALDLYGAVLSHWHLAQLRDPGAARIRVYNPDPERDGWQSPHTAIELVSDDMPFVVDSLTMELNRLGVGLHLLIHPVLTVRRDGGGQLIDVLAPGESAPDARRESVLHAEVDRETDPARLGHLHDAIARVLEEVRAVVEDWPGMRERLRELADTLPAQAQPGADPAEVAESQAYLRWMDADHFTFLAYEEYELAGEGPERVLTPVPCTALGLLRLEQTDALADVGAAWTRAVETIPETLVLAKASTRATVHRPSYLDYVGIRRFDEAGTLVGERRFLGIYTTLAYWERAQQIPILRGKLERVLDRAGFAPDSHDRKGLLEVLEEYPRDELVQISPDELFETAMAILALGERQRVRLFVRRDAFGRFVSCLVFLPRDRFNTANRERIARALADALHATLDDWTTLLSESVLVRIHFLFRSAPGAGADWDVAAIEARLALVTRAWTDDFRDALVEQYGEEQGLERLERWAGAFPAGYREDWPARAAVADLGRIEVVSGRGGLAMCPYRPSEAAEGKLRCKLVSTTRPIALSDVLPIFENLGLAIADERPYELTPRGGAPVWIYDFGFAAQTPGLDADDASARLEEAFVGVWRGEHDNDPLNRLVLDAELSAREVMLLRAVSRWLRQAEPALSGSASARALIAAPDVAASLVELFHARLDPQAHDDAEAGRIAARITHRIDAVTSLEEDRVLRSLLAVIGAMTRTDYWQRDPSGNPKPSIAFKLDPQRLALLPAPRPHFEIFVHSPRVEGVHLRGGPIARGGLRWSERREDFRTEVLALMKAQTVKNAVIVPVGAKGGFVVRGTPSPDEVVACYRTFVASLLSLTDNAVGDEVVAPADTVRLDGDDPYLVVAADKGTATFSDIANETGLRAVVLAGRRVRIRRVGGLRPQAHGDHRPRRVGGGARALPRTGHRRAAQRLHGGGHRRHVG